jgi:hypothetical protein
LQYGSLTHHFGTLGLLESHSPEDSIWSVFKLRDDLEGQFGSERIYANASPDHDRISLMKHVSTALIDFWSAGMYAHKHLFQETYLHPYALQAAYLCSSRGQQMTCWHGRTSNIPSAISASTVVLRTGLRAIVGPVRLESSCAFTGIALNTVKNPS